MIHIEEVYKS